MEFLLQVEKQEVTDLYFRNTVSTYNFRLRYLTHQTTKATIYGPMNLNTDKAHRMILPYLARLHVYLFSADLYMISSPFNLLLTNYTLIFERIHFMKDLLNISVPKTMQNISCNVKVSFTYPVLWTYMSFLITQYLYCYCTLIEATYQTLNACLLD